jgi:hypothetical protein
VKPAFWVKIAAGLHGRRGDRGRAFDGNLAIGT